jgi:methylase of polypeptide subunit release factors
LSELAKIKVRELALTATNGELPHAELRTLEIGCGSGAILISLMQVLR